MTKLVLIRHGESEWNKLNLFTGWTDVELSEKGVQEAITGGKLLNEAGFRFDVAYTSTLKRAIHTCWHVLDGVDQAYLPVIKDYRLNERHYGALQGLNKKETAEKYGAEQVHQWRRSFDIAPPALEDNDPRSPALQDMYKNVDPKVLPLHESLKDTIARVVPYYNDVIVPEIKAGKKVLIAAHGNSLRALVKYLKNISDEDIAGLNIPTGVPYVFELDDNLNVVKDYYLGDQEAIQAKINAVKNQDSVKK